MDREAQLAADARDYLMFEREYAHRFMPDRLRDITRDTLADRAKELGFADSEIFTAIDAAIAEAAAIKGGQ